MTEVVQAPRRPRPVLRRVSVARVQPLTPRMVRLTLAGAELAGFTRNGAAGHVRLWVPNAEGEFAVPALAAEGVEIAPERRSPSRVYTPRYWDAERLELDLDILLHGSGPLSSWAAQARVGDPLIVAGPGGVYVPDPAGDWFLLAGDETAIPAIGTLLEALPPYVEIQALIEVQDESDELSLPAHPRAHVRWLHRGELFAGAALANALHQVSAPDNRSARIWVACESNAVRVIRRDLLARRIVEPEAMHTRGYWKYGTSNHPDHDMGQD
jgi:NADPH-dependent ferric siderophore reductase